MTVYILRNIASDLTGGADFSNKMLAQAGTLGTLIFSVAAGATEVSRGFTDPGIPNNVDWQTGDVIVKATPGSVPAGLLQCAIQVHRINSSGTIQESTSISAEQLMVTSTTLTFTFSGVNWTAGAAGDRFRVDFRIRNTSGSSQSARLAHSQAGTTQLETVISENVNPNPGTLTLAAPSASISKGTLTMSPSPATMSLAVPNVSITLGTFTLTPSPVDMPLTAPNVAIGKGTLQIMPDPAVMTLAAPTSAISVLIVPSPVLMTLGVPSVDLQKGAITLTPDPVVMSFAVPDIAVGQTVIRPTVVTMALAVPSVTIIAGAFTLEPDPVEMTFVLPFGQIIKSTGTLEPDSVGLTLAMPSVSISVGSFTLEPDPVAMVMGAIPIPQIGPPATPPYRMVLKMPVARRVVFE